MRSRCFKRRSSKYTRQPCNSRHKGRGERISFSMGPQVLSHVDWSSPAQLGNLHLYGAPWRGGQCKRQGCGHLVDGSGRQIHAVTAPVTSANERLWQGYLLTTVYVPRAVLRDVMLALSCAAGATELPSRRAAKTISIREQPVPSWTPSSAAAFQWHTGLIASTIKTGRKKPRHATYVRSSLA